MATRFGRYLLDRRLAIGGMAEVFLGRVEGPAGFEKKVVIKRILPHHSNDQRYVNMFLDEARIAARFNHPNLVQIHELAKLQGQFCMVMEYIEGKDLETVRDLCIRQTRYMPLSVLAFVIAEAAEGLHYAHELTSEDGEPLNVVHRDVSPANIIMTWIGGIKVVDFGIAKSNQSSTETEAGVIKGKFSYLSPEQAAGQPLDRRSDVFSLGTILFELATLTQCFTRASTFETLDAVAAADFVEPRKLRPDLPPVLNEILKTMLARDREQRYATAVEVSRHLRRFMTEVGVPVASDVQAFLEDLFGAHHSQPNRSYNPLASAIEIPVDDEYSNPAVIVPESTRQHMLAEAMRERDDEITAPTGVETVDLGPAPALTDASSEWDEKTIKAEPEWLQKTLRAITPAPPEAESEENPWGDETVQASVDDIDLPTSEEVIRPTTPLPRKGRRPAEDDSDPGFDANTSRDLEVPELDGEVAAQTPVPSRPTAAKRREPTADVLPANATIKTPARPRKKHNRPSADKRRRNLLIGGSIAALLGAFGGIALLRSMSSARVGATTLYVISEPSGGTVSIDGVEHGATPLGIEGLAIGTVHRVAVELAGYVRHEEMMVVEARPSGAQRLEVVLTHQPPSTALDRTSEPGPDTPGPETPEEPPTEPTAAAADPQPNPEPVEPKPTKTKPVAKAKPRPRYGVLSLTSKPTMDVKLDGRKVGTTPIRGLRLAPGNHTLEMGNAKFNLKKNLKITVRAGDVIKRDVSFGKGRVVLSVRPWADVFLNGKKVGTTPMPPLTLWEGTHELRLINPQLGAQRTKRIVIKPNDTVKVVESLE